MNLDRLCLKCFICLMARLLDKTVMESMRLRVYIFSKSLLGLEWEHMQKNGSKPLLHVQSGLHA